MEKVHTTLNKNTPIEALRFIFTCIICMWHFSSVANFIHHGYIAVEFFFILSGVFLYYSFKQHPEIGTVDFTLNKIKKFSPPFFTSLILLILLDRKLYLYINDFTPDGILRKYYAHIHEFFFCQALGFTNIVQINGPIWFVSILLIGGGILYSLLRNYGHRAISLFIPLLSLFGFNYLLGSGKHSLTADTFFIPGIYTYWMRGISEMGLGIVFAYIFNLKEQSFIRHKIIFNIIAVLSLIGFVLMTLACGNYDYLAIFLVPLFLTSCFTPESIMQKMFFHSFWNFLGGISMYMYFIHFVIASTFYIILQKPPFMQMPIQLVIILYLITVVISAYLLQSLSQFILHKTKKHEGTLVYK